MLREESLAAVSATGFVGVIPTTNAPPQNVRAAADWYLARASSGDPAAQSKSPCVMLKVAAWRRTIPAPPPASVKRRSTASAAAQYDLGILYDKGLGLARDPIEAVIWYQSVADQNQPLAQAKLGMVYLAGGLYREIRKRPSAGYGARRARRPTPRRRLPVFMNKGMASRARIKAPMAGTASPPRRAS